MPPSASAVSGDGSVSVKRLTPTSTCSPRLDPRDPLAVGLDQRRLHVRHRLDRAAVLLDARHLRARALDAARRRARPSPSSPRRCRGTRAGRSRRRAPAGCAATTAGPTGRGSPSASFQAGQLDRPGAGVAAERDRQRLEHDPLDVVLRLGLGQPERVDLHAVAEAQRCLGSSTP